MAGLLTRRITRFMTLSKAGEECLEDVVSDFSLLASGRWRISEAMLHSVANLGGWPGAYLAQHKFRHKTRKLEFQIVFRAIVLLYQIAALDVILDHHFSQELFGMLKDG